MKKAHGILTNGLPCQGYLMTSNLAPVPNGSDSNGGGTASKGEREAEKKAAKERRKLARKRLIQYAKKEGVTLAAGVVALMVNSVTNMSFPRIMGKVLDKTGKMKGSILKNKEFQAFLLGAFGIFSCGAVASYVRVSSFRKSKSRIERNLRGDLFGALMRQEKGFFDQNSSAELCGVLNEKVNVAADAATTTLENGVRGLCSTINGTCLLLYISPKLTALSVSVVPLVAGTAMLYWMRVKGISKAQEAEAKILLNFSAERVAGAQTVKLFSQEESEISKFEEMLDSYTELTKRYASARGTLMGGLNISLNSTLISVLLFGGSLIKQGKITTGELTSFALYSSLVGLGAASLARFGADFAKGLTAAADIFEFMDRIPSMPDKGLTYDVCKGHIHFRHVGFSYPTRPDVQILKDINFEVAPGSTVAVVGASGAGKSTIGHLLARLYDPDQGCITVDNNVLTSLKPSWLRTQIGVVDQEPVLFAGTIAQNIKYGHPDATEEEMLKAAREANADEFISRFPEQYNTQVGEHGRQLSGGEKQRVAIARAILKNPPILLLDEATSSLDAESERLVNDALERAMACRTTIIIAHRKSTIQEAKNLMFLNDGKIEAEGCYDELLQKSPAFSRLMNNI